MLKITLIRKSIGSNNYYMQGEEDINCQEFTYTIPISGIWHVHCENTEGFKISLEDRDVGIRKDLFKHQSYMINQKIVNGSYISEFQKGDVLVFSQLPAMIHKDDIDMDDEEEEECEYTLPSIQQQTLAELIASGILTGYDFKRIIFNEPGDYGSYTASCSHKWKKYVGLSQTFEYCEKCDKKKEV